MTFKLSFKRKTKSGARKSSKKTGSLNFPFFQNDLKLQKEPA